MRRIGFLALVVALGCRVAQADGMLDPSFGKGGLVITDFGGGMPPPYDVATSLVVLPDGRAVAAGYTNPNLPHTNMAVARYIFSGELDTTFGGDGMVVIAFPPLPTGDSHAVAEAVLLQPDGRLVLVGGAVIPTTGTVVPFGIAQSVFALVRLNADGSFDETFGTGGVVTTPTDGGAVAGLLQPDGRIVAVGQSASFVVAARYNADGSLDPSFGTGGVASVPISDFGVEAAALQPDGKLVIAGAHPWPSALPDFALIRLLPGGGLDLSFDGDGLATADFGVIEYGRSVTVLADGRLVVAGSWAASAADWPGDFALTRFMPDGSVDTTFGNAGLSTADSGDPDQAEQVIQLPNGKLQVAGWTDVSGPKSDFLLARFLPDGLLDTSFGTGGLLRTDFNGGQDQCTAVALAGPDLVLAAGSSFSTFEPTDFALARYIASTPVELLAFEVE